MNQIDQIIAYENGDLDLPQVAELFQDLINTDLAWQLQGSYGRTALQLMMQGHCEPRDLGANTKTSNGQSAHYELNAAPYCRRKST